MGHVHPCLPAAYLVTPATSCDCGPVTVDCMETAAGAAAGLLNQLKRGLLNRMKWMRSARTIKKIDMAIKVRRGSKSNHILHTVTSS